MDFLNEQGMVIPVYNDINDVIKSKNNILAFKNGADYRHFSNKYSYTYIDSWFPKPEESLQYALENGLFDFAKYFIIDFAWIINITKNDELVLYIKNNVPIEKYIDGLLRTDIDQIKYVTQLVPEIFSYPHMLKSIINRPIRKFLLENNCPAEPTEIYSFDDLVVYMTRPQDELLLDYNIVHWILTNNNSSSSVRLSNLPGILQRIEYLYNNHFIIFSEMLLKRDTRGNTPLHYLTFENNENTYKILEMCLDAGADIRAVNNVGQMIGGITERLLNYFMK